MMGVEDGGVYPKEKAMNIAESDRVCVWERFMENMERFQKGF